MIIVTVSGFEPDFLVPLENVTIAQGRDATFTCVVNNLGGYRVSGELATARVCIYFSILLNVNSPRPTPLHNCAPMYCAPECNNNGTNAPVLSV